LNLLKKYRLVSVRAFGLTLVGLFVLSVNPCDAQLIRGRWQRMKPVEQDVVTAEKLPNRSSWKPTSNAKPWMHSTNRISDRWGRPDPLNVEENNSRYIGGFHYTYFQDLGIPTGDIGLRGNGVFWRPW
jgi:hypothetical protein